jgi:hypothetical protein
MKGLTLLIVLFYCTKTWSQRESPDRYSEPILVENLKEADSVREEIKEFIWKDLKPENSSSLSYTENVDLRKDVPGEYTELTHLGSTDRLTINLKYGFTSKVYILHPKQSNQSGIPIIYHSGHNIVFFHEDHLVNDSGACALSALNFFLEKGFDIIGISMPLVGYNDHPAVVTEGNKQYDITRHDDLFQLKDPLYYFITPVQATVDFLAEKKGYKKFIMMGLSGGGWTTTIYSAMDTRIWLSFPVAGSIPVPLRTSNKDKGDEEQYFASFYNKFNYSTLYTLAATGPHRLTCQILNQHDDCCFAFDANEYWAPKIRSRLASMGESGHYEFYLDRCAPFHKLSAEAVQKIYDEIKKAFVREGLRL